MSCSKNRRRKNYGLFYVVLRYMNKHYSSGSNNTYILFVALVFFSCRSITRGVVFVYSYGREKEDVMQKKKKKRKKIILMKISSVKIVELNDFICR
jgi:hypothetical protein